MRMVLTVLVGATVLSCGGEAPRSRVSQRDSAGVTIVNNGKMTAPSEWTISDEPLVTIGVRDGADPDMLFQVVGAFRLTDGRIVIANGGTSEWRFYDSTGAFNNASGGRGGGPGELRVLYEVSLLPGDTLVAFDPMAQRVDWFDDNGAFLRRTAVNVGEVVEPGYLTESAHLLPDRSLLVRVYQSDPSPPEGVYRPRLGFLRVTADMVTRDTLAWMGALENFVIRVAERRVPGVRPFARRAVETWGGDYVYIADTDRYDIYVYQLSTGTRRRIRRDVPPIPVTDADRAEFVENYREFMGRSRRPAADLERWLAGLSFPATKPPIRGLRADRAGWLWVGEEGSNEDSTEIWSVFDTDGQLQASVALPVRSTLLDIGDDYILVRYSDEADVEFVRLYALTRR